MTRDGGPAISRRHLLALAGAGTAAWLVPQLAEASPRREHTGFRPVLGPPPGRPLAGLPELRMFRGAAGIATGYLTAAPMPASNLEAGALAPEPLAYNGTFPGPVIRLVDGQSARVILRNRAGVPTNLHLHGLRIPPHTDAPFAHVHDGDDHTYRFRLPAGSAGTYWYHPHLHGDVEDQMQRGLTGPLLVEPAQLPPPLAGSEDHLVLLTTRLDASDVLVNGAPTPTLAVTTPMVRLRLLNAGVGRTLTLLLLETTGAGAGRIRPMWAVATDGGYLDRPVRLRQVTLAAGERVEVLVDATVSPVALVTQDDSMAQLTLTGPSTALRPPPAGQLGHVLPVRPPAHARYRRLVLDQADDGSFRMDGKLFDERRVDQRVKAGTTEVWDIVNRTGVEHPFHLHTWPFQVLRRGNVPEPFAAWRDIALVPPGETVRIAIPFTLNKGRTVYHCHIAMHEDAGMMGVVEVM